tara:strand:- start:14 stop:151 length:138 start_codon:yes stop_codon:yes gene_type:complete
MLDFIASISISFNVATFINGFSVVCDCISAGESSVEPASSIFSSN